MRRFFFSFHSHWDDESEPTNTPIEPSKSLEKEVVQVENVTTESRESLAGQNEVINEENVIDARIEIEQHIVEEPLWEK